MLAGIHKTFQPPVFEDSRKTHIARLLQLTLWMVLGLVALIMIAALIAQIQLIPSFFVIGALFLFTLVSYALLVKGYVSAASLVLISSLWVFFTLMTIFYGGPGSPGFSGYIVIILIGRLLLDRWARIVLTLVTAFTSLLILVAEVFGVLQPLTLPVTAISLWIIQITLFAGALLLLQIANRRRSPWLKLPFGSTYTVADMVREGHVAGDYTETRASDLERRIIQLQVASAIARDATTLSDLDGMMMRAVNLVRDRFGFYYAGIFLVDDNGEYAVLKAATGDTGTRLLELGHRLKIGEAGIVGYVTGTGLPRIALDVGNDSAFMSNPYLSETRSEMTLPLKIGNKVIGALDVQSEKKVAFDNDDLYILQIMADQLAVAIENALLFDATGRQLSELTVLHAVATAGAEADSEDALVEKTTELIGETLYSDNFGVLLIDEASGVLRIHPSYRGLSEDVKKATFPLEKGIVGKVITESKPYRINDVSINPDYVVLSDQMHSELCVPIKMGEHVLGVINAESASRNAFTDSDQRLLSTIAGQLATAIEKVRLFEAERQRASELAVTLAQREELIRLKSEFIQNVSHELRTPLAIVRGYVELLNTGEGGDLSLDQKEMMSIISRRINMLTKLVEDLTVILEGEARKIKLEDIDLGELFYSMLADFQDSSRQAGLSLTAEIDPDVPHTNGTPVHFQRVLDNLVGNAIKFTPAGGKIHIHLWHTDSDILFTVEDSGVGIPKERLERIFERFYQVDGSTKRRYGGTGLGLALVKEIIELYGGEISVKSDVGKGSTFKVRIPISKSFKVQP